MQFWMYIRRVKTASGATAVQLVEKRHGMRQIVEHLGSAHDEVTLAALEQVGRQKSQGNQQVFDLNLHTENSSKKPSSGVDAGGGLVLHGTRPRLLWKVLEAAYDRIRFTEAVDGSRITKAFYDLAAHFERHGNHFAGGQPLESTRGMGTGAKARDRRVVYHYSFQRERRDNYTLNKQIEKAEKVANGTRPLKRDRFVKLAGKKPGVDLNLVERARQLLGLKEYVSNICPEILDGPAVVAAYHSLWQVEKSFRMAKSDIRARPMFHHQRDSIEAQLTVVFCALAVAPHLQDATGLSINKIVQALKLLRTVTIDVNGRELPAAPAITPMPRTSSTRSS